MDRCVRSLRFPRVPNTFRYWSFSSVMLKETLFLGTLAEDSLVGLNLRFTSFRKTNGGMLSKNREAICKRVRLVSAPMARLAFSSLHASPSNASCLFMKNKKGIQLPRALLVGEDTIASVLLGAIHQRPHQHSPKQRFSRVTDDYRRHVRVDALLGRCKGHLPVFRVARGIIRRRASGCARLLRCVHLCLSTTPTNQKPRATNRQKGCVRLSVRFDYSMGV